MSILLITFPKLCLLPPNNFIKKVKEIDKKVHFYFLEKNVSEKNGFKTIFVGYESTQKSVILLTCVCMHNIFAEICSLFPKPPPI